MIRDLLAQYLMPVLLAVGEVREAITQLRTEVRRHGERLDALHRKADDVLQQLASHVLEESQRLEQERHEGRRWWRQVAERTLLPAVAAAAAILVSHVPGLRACEGALQEIAGDHDPVSPAEP